MNARERGERTKTVYRIGGAFMLSPQMKAAGKELGTRGWQTYMLGRGGVLGDVSPELVAAAMHFFPVEFVRDNWNAGRAVVTPEQAVARYAQACHEWGRAYLAAAPDLDVLDRALARVTDAAPAAGKLLFVGWRAVALPEDLPARVAQRCHVLREHRMGCHSAAVLAVGLSPIEAVAATNGEANLSFFNWPTPYPDREPLLPAAARAEELTDEIAGRDWAVLTDDEFDETARLLNAAWEAADVALAAAP